MRSTLLTAQKMATSMVSEAEQKRDAIIADAASGAKARLTEIQNEVSAEEERLVSVRQEVEQQIQAEKARLSTAQEELRSFIQSVRRVCEGELALLERLPELPAQPEPPQQPPVVQAAPVVNDAVEEVAAPSTRPWRRISTAPWPPLLLPRPRCLSRRHLPPRTRQTICPRWTPLPMNSPRRTRKLPGC